MPELIPCTYRKIRKILLKLGFRERDATGSHVFFGHDDGRTTVAPRRSREFSKGLLKKILNDIQVSVEEYEKLRQKY